MTYYNTVTILFSALVLDFVTRIVDYYNTLTMDILIHLLEYFDVYNHKFTMLHIVLLYATYILHVYRLHTQYSTVYYIARPFCADLSCSKILRKCQLVMTDPDTLIPLSKIQKLQRWYSAYRKEYPILTKAVTRLAPSVCTVTAPMRGVWCGV